MAELLGTSDRARAVKEAENIVREDRKIKFTVPKETMEYVTETYGTYFELMKGANVIKKRRLLLHLSHDALERAMLDEDTNLYTVSLSEDQIKFITRAIEAPALKTPVKMELSFDFNKRYEEARMTAPPLQERSVRMMDRA